MPVPVAHPETLKLGQVHADTSSIHVLTLADFSGVVLR